MWNWKESEQNAMKMKEKWKNIEDQKTQKMEMKGKKTIDDKEREWDLKQTNEKWLKE